MQTCQCQHSWAVVLSCCSTIVRTRSTVGRMERCARLEPVSTKSQMTIEYAGHRSQETQPEMHLRHIAWAPHVQVRKQWSPSIKRRCQASTGSLLVRRGSAPKNASWNRSGRLSIGLADRWTCDRAQHAAVLASCSMLLWKARWSLFLWKFYSCLQVATRLQ